MSWRTLEATTPGEVLTPAFCDRPALIVARELLGCWLCRQETPGGPIARWVIHETEAYTGPDDLACHAAKGRTARTEVMFGPPGTWYIYLCYGVHWMANLVCEREGYPAAVLLRGAGLADGPGKVTKRLTIGKDQHSHLATPTCGLWVEVGLAVPDSEVLTGPRIGIGYAGEWVDKPYRFLWTRGIEGLRPAK